MKNTKKLMTVLLALCLAIGMMTCSFAAYAEDEIPDWETFEDWQKEEWDEKEIAYQFTGEWELAEYHKNYSFLINLYKDGSAMADQRDINSASSYVMYGFWSEEETEDGNEITLDTLYVTGLEGDLVEHEYNYTLYEEEDGNYSFGFTFGIAPGMYFREVDVEGGKEVTYEKIEDFYTAVDQPAA